MNLQKQDHAINGIFMYIKYLLKFLVVYSFVMFLYTAFMHTPLGKGFEWVCFEPGCVILNSKSTITVYGDVEKLALTDQYIFGKVKKPNAWMIENEGGYNIEGYFILNKKNNDKFLALNRDEFLSECKRLDIGSCILKYPSPFWVVYDPYYWYVIVTNMFE